MNHSATAIVATVFEEVAASSALVGREQLTIWGGHFNAEQVDSFLNAWGPVLEGAMPWRMIEEVSRFELAHAGRDVAWPQEWFAVERLRLFGPAGDLELRRDGARFHWRFIGEANGPDGPWPALPAVFAIHDFWAEPDQARQRFRPVTRRYYQWRGDEREQRVDSRRWLAAAGLADRDVYLVQIQYLDSGRIAFVRYTGFEPEPAMEE